MRGIYGKLCAAALIGILRPYVCLSWLKRAQSIATDILRDVKDLNITKDEPGCDGA
jgi:hypothetical protein